MGDSVTDDAKHATVGAGRTLLGNDVVRQLTALVPPQMSQGLASELLTLGAQAVDVSPVEGDTRDVRVISYWSASELVNNQRRAQAACRQLAQRLRIHPIPRLEVRKIRPDWETSWALALPPARLTRDLTLVAEGVAYEGAAGERVLRLEPGLYFGFGEHPTTQLIGAWIGQHCVGKTVLDVGCGTGVLAFIALHVGASRVLGVDIDVPSVESARRNADKNGFAPPNCTFSTQALAEVTETFDVVVANIDARTLGHLAPDLLRVCKPGARLALTGVLLEQAAELQARFEELGSPVEVVGERDGWVLLSR